MNRTNSGANTNTESILLDILIVLSAFLIDIIIFRKHLTPENIWAFTVLVFVFITIFVLANRAAYLYNVTMFFYFDRVHRKISISFFAAAVMVLLLLSVLGDIAIKRHFFAVFFIIVYICICLKMFLHTPLQNLMKRRIAPRTAFVGKVEEYNKFKYFMKKTSVVVKEIGYIAKTREEFEKATEGEYIGCLDELEEIVRTYNLDQLYIMQKREHEHKLTQQYVDLCIKMGVTVRLIVDFYKRRRAYSYVSTIGTYPVIAYHTITLNTYTQNIKRVVDIIGASVGIILSSPIMLITAIAIKIDSPGPVLFKQPRIGQNGRVFNIYKFRSMYTDAEERKKELMEKNEIDGNVMFKMKDDPRITKVGKFIRKLSIDEFPQFFNVLFGSMSLVGTRPPTKDEVEKYNTSQWRRISIKPGITGMWQVNGRSKVKNFDDIVELDVEYIDNWSLWLDFKIMLKTVFVLLKHDDAY